MTDSNNNSAIKPKLQLRSGLSFNDKTPSPAAKLLINHGKPNFTIQRSPKVQQNGESNPLSPRALNGEQAITIINNNNNNQITLKNTNGMAEISVKSAAPKVNGLAKPNNLPLQNNNAINGDPQDSGVEKVVLRRVIRPQDSREDGDDENVPEFIRRQRRIQERLAKDNILDFENRRSGYFTQVLMSPTAPNKRTSFVETMSSPAVVPSLEMPPPVPTSPPPTPIKDQGLVEVDEEKYAADEILSQSVSALSAPLEAEPIVPQENGHHHQHTAEEEEVANAIAEVNKAVEGEDDEAIIESPPIAVAVTTSLLMFDDDVVEPATTHEEQVKTAAEATIGDIVQAAVAHVEVEIAPAQAPASAGISNGHAAADEDIVVDVDAKVTTNGHGDEVTISHTNGTDGPSIPAADPSGALGVNFEPKAVTSFAKDLSSEPNKYPDTVKVTKADGESSSAAPLDADLAEMAKLKFDIKTDEQDVQVTPVLRAE